MIHEMKCLKIDGLGIYSFLKTIKSIESIQIARRVKTWSAKRIWLVKFFAIGNIELVRVKASNSVQMNLHDVLLWFPRKNGATFCHSRALDEHEQR